MAAKATKEFRLSLLFLHIFLKINPQECFPSGKGHKGRVLVMWKFQNVGKI
jgi:hypothetical protein